MRGEWEEGEALQLPQGTLDPTEKVNVYLNHLHCSVTHIYTQPNAEILDKEGNEVERLLQEQNNPLALWPPMMHHVVAMEIWRRILLLLFWRAFSIPILTLTFCVCACVCVFVRDKEFHFFLSGHGWLPGRHWWRQEGYRGLSDCLSMFRFQEDKQKKIKPGMVN